MAQIVGYEMLDLSQVPIYQNMSLQGQSKVTKGQVKSPNVGICPLLNKVLRYMYSKAA